MKKTNENKDSIKKPVYKNWWFWVIIVIGLSAIFGNMGNDNEDTSNTTATTEQGESQSTEKTKTPQVTEDVSADKFVDETRSAIQGAIGEGESITDIVLKDRDLCVYVDFSKVDPSPLTLEDLALARTSSITDAILELNQYDSLWKTMTVDFGKTGHITNQKADMEDNGFGRYFPAEDFKLE